MDISSGIIFEEETMEIDVKMYCESVDLIPEYAKEGDSGFDFRANIPEGEEVIIPSKNKMNNPLFFWRKEKVQKNWKLIPTGVKVQLPVGYEIQVRPRSGLAYKNAISIINSPGTIDSGYRGDIGVILINNGIEPFVIKRGDRIAQGVVMKVEKMNRIPVSDPNLLSDTTRGEGGFGHTGIKNN